MSIRAQESNLACDKGNLIGSAKISDANQIR